MSRQAISILQGLLVWQYERQFPPEAEPGIIPDGPPETIMVRASALKTGNELSSRPVIAQREQWSFSVSGAVEVTGNKEIRASFRSLGKALGG